MSDKEKKNKNGFFLRSAAKKVGDAYERSLEKDDPIYLEPIHKDEVELEDKRLVRGGIDVYFLIIVLAISLIGVVMAYSASSFDGQKYMGDSLYYVKKTRIVLGLGIGLYRALRNLRAPVVLATFRNIYLRNLDSSASCRACHRSKR